MFKKIYLVAAILFLAGLGMAQTMQTGNLVGTVTSADGALPGVTVTIKSPAMILPSMTMITGANGAFRFMGLAPGTYVMTFEMPGMQTVIRQGVRVLVAQNTTIDIALEQKTLEESVTVIGRSPTVDKQRTTRAINLDRVFLASIPAARNLAAFFNMSPGVTQDSAHGGSTMDNSYNLDGVNMVDAATGVANVVFGLDIMDEISVQQGGLSAEYGSVRGAMVNIVSKSGGNKFSGTASFYFNHESLKSDNTQGTPLAGSKSGNKMEMEPVLSVGGPVIKDKLWFYAMGSYNQQERFVAGYPAGVAAGQETPIKNTTIYPFLKLSFQPSPNDKFTLSYNFSNNLQNDSGATQFTTESVTQKITRPTHVVSAQWTKFFNPNFFANLRLGMNHQSFMIHAKGDSAQFVETNTNIASGNAWRNRDDNWRIRYQVNADGTAFIDNLAGTHELKFGGEAQLAFVRWNVYGVADPVSGGSWNQMLGGNYYWTLVLVNNGFDRKDNMYDLAGFVQDNWSINRHLNLSLGLRLEYNSVVYPPQNTAEGPVAAFGQTYNRGIPESMLMYKWLNLAPRLGMIYDLFADGKTLFKASWSRYIIPNQIGFVNVAHPNGWFGFIQYMNPDGSWIPGLFSPWALPGGAQNPNGTLIGYTAADGTRYNLKAGYTDELTIGVEKELLPDFSVSARYIRKWDRNQPNFVDAAQLDMDLLMSTGELDWSRNWTSRTGTDPYNGQTVTFYQKISTSARQMYLVNPPGANRDYNGFEFSLDKRYSNNWAFNFSYVYAKSTGLITTARGDESLGGASNGFFQSPNAHTNADGVLPLERRHQFKFTGLVRGPFGVNLSGYFQYLTGAPVTRIISNNFVGVALIQNVTINAEKRGSTHLPPVIQLDLRLEKTFRISVINLGLFADCFNVFNRGAATAAWLNSSNTSRPYLQMTTINNPRIFQLGARIEY